MNTGHSPAAVAEAAALLRRRFGLDFLPSRVRALEEALAQLSSRPGISLDDLVARLHGDNDLLERLIDQVTVGETYFLREPEQCRWIRDVVFRSWAQSSRPTPFRIWSAGCASGEEAYTLAILCREAGIAGRVRILGTDVSAAAIRAAAARRYGRWSLRNTTAEWRDRYFTREGDSWRLDPAIAGMVELRKFNLADDESAWQSLPRFDLVLCRNVLIYFGAAALATVSRRLLSAITDEGWLVLGASDPALWYDHECQVTMTGSGVAYRRQGRRKAPDVVQRADSREELPPAEPVAAPEVVSLPGEPVQAGAVPDDRESVHEVIAQIRAQASAGHRSEAGRLCAAAIDSHRLDPELSALHATLLLDGGAPAAAVTAARRALYLDRNLVVARLTLAAGLIATGQRAEARRVLERATVALDESDPDAPVRGSGGVSAAVLSELARAQLRVVGEERR
jgi:chemotaxis protein methyltransferase CheR